MNHLEVVETHDCVITYSRTYFDGQNYYDFFENSNDDGIQFQSNNHYRIEKCICNESYIVLEFDEESASWAIDTDITWDFIESYPEAAIMRMLLR